MPIMFMGRIGAASHVWMRRQLLGLGTDVCAFVGWGARPHGCEHVDSWIDLDRQRPFVLTRALNRMRVLSTDPWEEVVPLAVKRAAESPEVSRILVHFLTTAVEFADVWRAVNKPVFVHCHGYDITWKLRQHDPPFAPVFSERYPLAVKELPDTVQFIANSVHTRDRLTEIGIDAQRVHLKPLGVPVAATCVSKRQRRSGVNILFLGRLVDFKGPELVIKAFDIACQRGLEGTLTIAGDGPLRTTCELLCRRSTFSERIRFVGEVDERAAAKLRGEADIFTAHNCTGPITGQLEAFGVSLIEAMADGLAVVTGASGGPTEFIKHEENGLLVEPGDVAAHAAMFKLLGDDGDLRTKLGEAARRTVQQHYTIEEEIRNLKNILFERAGAPVRDRRVRQATNQARSQDGLGIGSPSCQ